MDYSSKIIGLIFASLCLWFVSYIPILVFTIYKHIYIYLFVFLMSYILVSIYLDRVILNKPIVDQWIYFGIGLILLGYFIIIYKYY